jgi:tetrahydromethanopterin S-methyltransferase subunit G
LESAKSKSEGNDVITVQREIEPEDYIEAQLRHQSARLDTIEEKVENLRKR